MEKMYYRMGTLFFTVSTVYVCALICKTFVWWQWLNALQNILDLNNEGLIL